MISRGDNMKCKICKKKIELNYGDGLNNKLILLQVCFDCNFWIDKFENVNHINSVRIDNNHYWIGKESDPSADSFRGFSGRKFIIKFKNGREVKTTNLWHQGEIPKWCRKYLPDNATFVYKE